MKRLNKEIKQKINVGVDAHIEPHCEGTALNNCRGDFNRPLFEDITKSNKAITLVTLIITIIIMLILTGVMISITTDEDDVFDMAEDATAQWNNRITTEDNVMQNLLAKRNEILGGTTTPETPPVEGTITLNKSSLTLEIVDGVNSEETLTATKQNLSGTVSWTSSTPTVATVDSNGKVTTVGAGTTTITASCGGKTVTCEVTVEEYVTITVIQGSGVSIGHIREENGIVYYENCEFIKLKVKKGTKVAFDDYILPEMGVWGDGPEDFPMTSEEYDSFVTSNSYGTFPERTLLPCFTSKCSISPIRYYNETLGYVDVENYYATETITFTMKDSD